MLVPTQLYPKIVTNILFSVDALDCQLGERVPRHMTHFVGDREQLLPFFLILYQRQQ